MEALLNLLKGAAPLLATAVAGPVGPLLLSKIAASFGAEDTIAAVTEAIRADPQAADKLRALELEHAKLDLANVSNARHMQEVALQQDDSFAKHFIYYFATFWSCCAALYIGFITFGVIPEDNVRFADTILGFILGTVIASIMNFFFGSSKSSRDKTDLMMRSGK
jgi:hypothetical protein